MRAVLALIAFVALIAGSVLIGDPAGFSFAERLVPWVVFAACVALVGVLDDRARKAAFEAHYQEIKRRLTAERKPDLS